MTLANLSPNEKEARADGYLPAFDWDNENKRAYLTLRVCGFGRKEARDKTEIELKTVKNWIAGDEAFAAIEKMTVMDIGDKFRKDVVVNGWVRNYWLMLERDARLIKKSESDKPMDYLSDREHEYLMKIRPMYTPAAMKIMTELFQETSHAESWEEILVIARKSSGSADNGSFFINQEASSEEEYTEGSFSEQNES